MLSTRPNSPRQDNPGVTTPGAYLGKTVIRYEVLY